MFRISDLFLSRIPDPQQQKREGGKNLVVLLKFHKIVNYSIFEQVQKNIWDNWQRRKVFFIQNNFTNFSDVWNWDPGSRKICPGSGSKSRAQKKHRIPDTESDSATLDLGTSFQTGVWVPTNKKIFKPILITILNTVQCAEVILSANLVVNLDKILLFLLGWWHGVVVVRYLL